jgi:hypothetical protein
MQAVRPQFHQPNWNCRPKAEGQDNRKRTHEFKATAMSTPICPETVTYLASAGYRRHVFHGYARTFN